MQWVRGAFSLRQLPLLQPQNSESQNATHEINLEAHLRTTPGSSVPILKLWDLEFNTGTRPLSKFVLTERRSMPSIRRLAECQWLSVRLIWFCYFQPQVVLEGTPGNLWDTGLCRNSTTASAWAIREARDLCLSLSSHGLKTNDQGIVPPKLVLS